ncbi:8-oxo-dGTP diphosphatase [Chaetoceros tenuissimus]|uniref:8-oxo-dGTP diphosphatase n=1 Tax=Chaetoceros tenuissimus TaxID=426638 RepID=A0AAD3CI15_9STRA|nr:8-oxo-dGTP diphosphatase [Chaetoceros tenuissimus]
MNIESTLEKEESICKKLSIEKQLFHELHRKEINSPNIKEFNECWAFAKTVRSHWKQKQYPFDLVIDVAGGHGALAALLLILIPSVKRAVVVDPAQVGNNGVEKAWGDFYKCHGKELQYRYECLRTGLAVELNQAIHEKHIHSSRILIVACHACQHLTDETLEIACSYGVHLAVMSCCQKDHTGGAWKAVGKNILPDSNVNLGIAPIMDLLTCGKVMSWRNGIDVGVEYQVRLKFIDSKITPQNRLILCKGMDRGIESSEKDAIAKAHARLELAYGKAHKKKDNELSEDEKSIVKRSKLYIIDAMKKHVSKNLVYGFIFGYTVSLAMSRRKT